MRLIVLIGVSILAWAGTAESPAWRLWTELSEKRSKLTNLRAEIDVSRTIKSSSGKTQASKWRIVLNNDQGRWREESISGSGRRIRIFDKKDLFVMEDGGEEFVRTKRRAKDPEPVPSSYLSQEADWSKAVEKDRSSCGLSGKNDQCVVLHVPLKPWVRSDMRMSAGAAVIRADLESGLILDLSVAESVQRSNSSYISESSYHLRRTTSGGAAEESLFTVPPDMREVKELSRWNVARIKKQLVGKAAPELTVNDMEGKPISLAAYKGKTVLLDFWTTWCPPCRADAPSLDKLYAKYKDRNLAIIGFSVSEDRAVVAKFLMEHPHEFPIILSSEMELPVAYQIGVFPTYIVIDPDGTLTAAVEGDQGFSELRKLLKKAGLDVD
jgi:thiol-disulfide isomerase/thioredoxin